jgi:hypothetical protein
VIALDLIRRDFSKYVADQFAVAPRAIHHFETMSNFCWKPAIHHERRMHAAELVKRPAITRRFAATGGALAFA